jgi:Kef-type K+ transport system membrane component KefB
MLLGNLPGLGTVQFVGADPYLDILSRVGMLLLLFEVGLDLSVRDLFAVGPSALLVAVLGTASSLALGTGTAALLMPGAPTAAHVFLGAAITATSVGITARVLKDMRASRSGEARIILGAAVVDDVLALVVLGAVMAFAGAGHNAAGSGATPIVALVMKTIGFLVLTMVLGMRFTPAWFRHAARLRTGGARSPWVSASASSCRRQPARSVWRPSSALLLRVLCWKTRIRRSSCSGASARSASSSSP